MTRRRLRRVSAIATAIVALTAVSVFAGQAPPAASDALHNEEHRHYDGPTVWLTDSIQEALTANPELAALRQQTDAARQRPAQERALAPPMIEAEIWQWPINTINPANTNMYMFMLTQDLPGHGKRDLRAAVAEKDTALAESDVTIRARQIVDEIRQAYAELFVARKAVDLHYESVDLLRQIADIAQAKYATGRTSQQDVLKPVLELSRLHTDILMFDEQADIATARLNTLLDRAPETPLGPLVDPSEETLLPTTSDLQRLALAHQPEIQRARVEIERVEAQLAVAQRDHKPDFSVQGGYMVVPNQADAVLARVGVTWPNAPWSRGSIDAHVAALTSALTAAKTRERGMENSVRLAVQEAYVHVRSAQDRVALLRTTILPQSQQTFQVSRIAYQTDRVDFQSLIDNERTLLDLELEYIRAQSEFQRAIADLERAIGADLPAGATVPVIDGGVR